MSRPIPNRTVVAALAAVVLAMAGFIALSSVSAYSPPTGPPLTGAIFGFLNLSPDLQYKLGPLSATSFFDTDNPTYLLNPSGISTVGGPLCLGTGQGTNTGATCGTGSQSMNQIKNAADPTDSQDAATKAYVDRCLQNGSC